MRAPRRESDQELKDDFSILLWSFENDWGLSFKEIQSQARHLARNKVKLIERREGMEMDRSV
jgi:hypothetical protein